MIKWIDIVSPTLKEYHQRWIELRGAHVIPHVQAYNKLLPILPTSDSAAALWPSNQNGPVFREVGIRVGHILQGCEGGTRFAEITPAARRTTVTLPFIRVMRARQPDCRRGSFRRGTLVQGFEQLLLPFGNDRMQVCVVHAVFDMDGKG